MEFLELLQVALGSRSSLTKVPTAPEWELLLAESQKQAIVGVMAMGLERLPIEQRPPIIIMLKWIGLAEMVKSRNQEMNDRCRAIEKMFTEAGFDYCILKGQGNALLYPNPLVRQSGDIDIWVRPKTEWSIPKTVKFLESKCCQEKIHVVYHHAEFSIWDDVEVEVHWRPSWRSSPFYNRRLQQWFREQADKQFSHTDEKTGMHVPTWEFNAVYLLQHMFLHVLQEGLGFRQVVDYYYLLKSSERTDTTQMVETIKFLGLIEFAGVVMYVLKEVLALEEQFLIVPADKKRGAFLLDEIMKSGNFGKTDERNWKLHSQTGVRKRVSQLKRKMRFVKDYPVEVLNGPSQVYHILWRKMKLWRWE